MYTTDVSSIPYRKVLHLPSKTVRYECPDKVWQEHFRTWGKKYGEEPTAPQPMPAGHLMFDAPEEYGAVPYGCEDEQTIRRAWREYTLSVLYGWSKDVPPDRLDAIVGAAVEAEMRGAGAGAAPFVLCLLSGA